MTVAELRRALKAMPQDALVNIAFDPIDFDAVVATSADIDRVFPIHAENTTFVVIEPKGQPHPLNH